MGTELHYRRIDVRDTELLNSVIEAIADAEGRMDGLVAAAGIQQETPALEYSAKDSNTMFEVNVTGVFMTAQAVAKQMIRFGNGGSIAMIASMSGTIANRVRSQPSSLISELFFPPSWCFLSGLVLWSAISPFGSLAWTSLGTAIPGSPTLTSHNPCILLYQSFYRDLTG